ncbi:coiled-coil domain-containing protein 151 [Pholidichthys leucotaenia]
MSLNVATLKPSLHDQATELQLKIQLQEADRTAYYQSSQATIKKNRETILQLRQENKTLYRNVAEATAGDEYVIKKAFHHRGPEKNAFRNMSGKEAVAVLEQKVLSKRKRLNALKHTTQTYQQRLEELKKEYQRMKPEGGNGTKSADARTRKKEEDTMRLRALENSLEKTQFKCKEAENIMTNYLKLKNHLQEESLTFSGQLDSLEGEILKHREELQRLQVLNNEAQRNKEAAKAELQQEEEIIYKERKERERIIASYKKKVEERKAQYGIDRWAQRTTIQPEELSSDALHSTTRMEGEEEKVISTFEEAFRHIKEATGVTHVQEIVERFNSQKETHERLEKLKEENEEVLHQLNEQKELLSQQFKELKYSGEAKVSSDQQKLEECELHLQAQKQRCDAAKERLEWLVKTLGTARGGVDQLARKLQHITLSEDTVAEVCPESDEFVVQLMNQCELKLQILHQELEGKDLVSIRKEMEKNEFQMKIEGKLPKHNTRVNLHPDQKLQPFDDEDESDEDEADIISRDVLKRQSQLIVDFNSKKKPWKKKKGTF